MNFIVSFQDTEQKHVKFQHKRWPLFSSVLTFCSRNVVAIFRSSGKFSSLCTVLRLVHALVSSFRCELSHEFVNQNAVTWNCISRKFCFTIFCLAQLRQDSTGRSHVWHCILNTGKKLTFECLSRPDAMKKIIKSLLHRIRTNTTCLLKMVLC